MDTVLDAFQTITLTTMEIVNKIRILLLLYQFHQLIITKPIIIIVVKVQKEILIACNTKEMIAKNAQIDSSKIIKGNASQLVFIAMETMIKEDA